MKESTSEKTKKITSSASLSKPEIRIYAGPTIPSLQLFYGTVYNPQLPDAAVAATEKYPMIARLNMPIRKQPLFIEQMRAGSGAYYSVYVELCKALDADQVPYQEVSDL